MIRKKERKSSKNIKLAEKSQQLKTMQVCPLFASSSSAVAVPWQQQQPKTLNQTQKRFILTDEQSSKSKNGKFDNDDGLTKSKDGCHESMMRGSW